MRDYDNIGQCVATPSKVDYYPRDLTFCTQAPPEYIIPLAEVKIKSNEVHARNKTRNQLFETQAALIQILEAGRDSLTAYDKREFKEMFQNIINEI